MLQSKRIHYPKSQEISYKVALLNFVYFIKKKINEILIPVVKDMPNTFHNDSYEIRCDDFIDDTEVALEQVRSLVRYYREDLIKTLPTRFRKLIKFTTKQVIESFSNIVSVETTREREIKAGVGIDIFNNNVLRPNLEVFVKSATVSNARLITSIEEQLLNDVAIVIEAGYRSGLSRIVLSKQIQEKFGVSEKRARLIARDQIGKLHADVIRDEYLTLGIVEYKWLTSSDERVRKTHKVLNDKICSWYDVTVYKDSVDDEEWKKRSSIGGVEKHPGQDYQCRCDPIAIFK